ncbi:MAG: hypothetical protein ACOYOH_26855 [Paracraurococcus sp.]
MAAFPLRTIILHDVDGREVIATLSSDEPPQLILARGVTTLRLPARDADRLWRWQQGWDEGLDLDPGPSQVQEP